MRLDSGAFRLDGQEVTVGEVLAASLVGGVLWPLIEEAAARRRGAELARERGLDASEDAVQAAFDAWRTERDLVSAEDLERWLELFGVELDDLVAFLEERLLCDLLGEQGDEMGAPQEPPPLEDLLPTIGDDALFGGEIARLVEGFGMRACAPEPAQGEDARLAEARKWMLAEAGFADEGAFVGAVEALGVAPRRAIWALDRELAYRMHQQDVLTQEALRQGVKDLRDELVRYEVISAVFRTEDVAREVACCVREDRDTFSRASARAGQSSRKDSWFQQDLDHSPFGSRIASAAPKDMFGPQLEPDGRALLAQLLSMQEPELSDPEVLGRVERRLVERSLRRELQRRVLFAPALMGGA